MAVTLETIPSKMRLRCIYKIKMHPLFAILLISGGIISRTCTKYLLVDIGGGNEVKVGNGKFLCQVQVMRV